MEGSLTTEKERYLRTWLWWETNDPVRNVQSGAPAESDFRENLIRLSALLNICDSCQRRTAAEGCREVSDFTAADSLLTFTFPDGSGDAVNLIKKLIDQRDALVREIV